MQALIKPWNMPLTESKLNERVTDICIIEKWRSMECSHFGPQCANRNKSRLLFSPAEMFKKPLWQNSVNPEQTARSSLFWVHAVCFYT